MSNESSKKGQQDRSEGEYKPPSAPGMFASEARRQQYYKDKEDYDRAWEVTKAQQDHAEQKYKPPPLPGYSDSDYGKERKLKERDKYDKSWDDSQKNKEDQDREKGSGCFITSACVEARGRKDDCIELEMLRSFRDTYIAKMDDGEDLIRKYYLLAPQIVNIINQSLKKDELYKWLYKELIQKSLDSIEVGENEAAFKNYKSIFEYLQYNLLNEQ